MEQIAPKDIHHFGNCVSENICHVIKGLRAKRTLTEIRKTGPWSSAPTGARAINIVTNSSIKELLTSDYSDECLQAMAYMNSTELLYTEFCKIPDTLTALSSEQMKLLVVASEIVTSMDLQNGYILVSLATVSERMKAKYTTVSLIKEIIESMPFMVSQIKRKGLHAGSHYLLLNVHTVLALCKLYLYNVSEILNVNCDSSIHPVTRNVLTLVKSIANELLIDLNPTELNREYTNKTSHKLNDRVVLAVRLKVFDALKDKIDLNVPME